MRVGECIGYRYDPLMKTYVALFRSINVGGNNLLPMNELVNVLENIGSRNVRTYIQSGNAVFQSEEPDASLLSARISAAIEGSHGFKPRVLLLKLEEMEKVLSANPFSEAESEPKTLHLFFTASAPPAPDLRALEDIKSGSERFALAERVFYLHAPDGIGRSNLAANVEKLLGVPATARNWRTVCKVIALANQDV